MPKVAILTSEVPSLPISLPIIKKDKKAPPPDGGAGENFTLM